MVDIYYVCFKILIHEIGRVFPRFIKSSVLICETMALRESCILALSFEVSKCCFLIDCIVSGIKALIPWEVSVFVGDILDWASSRPCGLLCGFLGRRIFWLTVYFYFSAAFNVQKKKKKLLKLNQLGKNSFEIN